MEIRIPEFSLVLLIGVSGSGKSSFAKKHFKKTEIISSDECRAVVSDDENNQAATNDAFELLHYTTAKRLKNRLLTVIDATNVQRESRKKLLDLARAYHCLPVAIVLDLGEAICEERNSQRENRKSASHFIRKQQQQLKKGLRRLKEEGFRKCYILTSEEEVNAVGPIIREKLFNDKQDETGPFDIIGDVHGCFEELEALLTKLGYLITRTEAQPPHFGFHVVPPEGRKAIFVGDLVDRGPDSPGVLRLVMSMVHSRVAYCVPGNHDFKLQKFLAGKSVQQTHGLDLTVKQLESESDEFKKEVERFIYGLVSHYLFDRGELVVAHAGIKEEMQGRASGAVRSFCIFGENTGEIDDYGLHVRYDWAREYRGKAKVVYGHTPVPKAEWLNRTMDVDTGCVFGGHLTALRYPEEELVSVKALQTYAVPARPIHLNSSSPQLSSQHLYDDLLDIADVTGKRIIQTRLRNNITIREENSIAALEVMSRFAVHPKWLIYLPPTMSPCATSELPDYLEYPSQALNYYKKRGVEKVICEEKHMGSRTVLVLCKDPKTAISRFGLEHEGVGVCYTRTGRNFFNDAEMEKRFIQRVVDALTKSGFWERFDTDWVCLDAELMPWSAKAQSLIREQYAAVGAAAGHALPEVTHALQKTFDRGITDALPSLEKFSSKRRAITKYIDAYRQYCWPVTEVDDYKLAPFHLLATEGAVHIDKNHQWHMEQIAEICKADTALLLPTPYKIIDLHDPLSEEEAINWWLDLTGKGGEGMVVKPYDFIAYDGDTPLQPAVKCRGRDYLRIIYGPEYDAPENLERLKNRGLSRKQSLALREFALGIEGLERFVNREPLRRVHESIFGVLALESEEVDPRL